MGEGTRPWALLRATSIGRSTCMKMGDPYDTGVSSGSMRLRRKSAWIRPPWL